MNKCNFLKPISNYLESFVSCVGLIVVDDLNAHFDKLLTPVPLL